MQTVKAIRYDRETGDFAYLLNGEIVGYAATYLAAEQKLNELVYELLSRPNVDAADLTPEEAADVLAVVAEPAPVPALGNVTRAAVAAALVVAQQKCAEDARWLRATVRAANLLDSNRWAFDGRRLIIASQSQPGGRHVVEPGRCTCTAFARGNACTHRAAYRLLMAAAAMPAQIVA